MDMQVFCIEYFQQILIGSTPILGTTFRMITATLYFLLEKRKSFC